MSGIFNEVYAGKLTRIVERFAELGANDILSLVIQRDERGRTPLDLAWYYLFLLNFYSYLGFKNIVLYLMTNIGTPSDVIHQELNVDNSGRNMFHLLCYKGNYESLIMVLNIERVYLRKTLTD